MDIALPAQSVPVLQSDAEAIAAPDRHWRNARVHTLHDPVRWKFHAIGNHALNGIDPPVHSWI